MIIPDLTAEVAPGRVCALIGPNGSGKTSLLRAVYRSLRPVAGTVRIDDDDVWSLSPRETARMVGTVLQHSTSAFGFTAAETVAMALPGGAGPAVRPGVNGRGSLPDRGSTASRALSALAEVGLAERGHEPMEAFSGGERQRIFLARALVGRPRLLVMDEPTNHLDLVHRHDLLAAIRASGLTALVSVHDLDFAFRCDDVMVLDKGRLVAHGPVTQTLDGARIRDVFSVRGAIVDHPVRHFVDLGRR